MSPLELGFGVALLRPLALLALLPFALWLALRRRRPETDGGPWREAVDAHLLPHLLAAPPDVRRASRWLAPLLVLLAVLALSGPALRETTSDAVVLRPVTTRLLLVDLSPAFAALPAERQALARRKLHALLAELPPAETALAVHAAAAYLVAPPTTDAATLARWLPELEAAAMPPARPGRDADGPAAALALAGEVLSRARTPQSELIWASARGLGELEAALAAAALPPGTVSRVLHLAPPAADAAPASPDGRRTTVPLRVDERDLAALRTAFAGSNAGPVSGIVRAAGETVAASGSHWRDLGPLLLPVLLALAAWSFWQRGTLLVAAALLLLPLLPVPPAHAAGRDSRASDPRWQAVAAYRAGDFAGAAAQLEPFADADSLYNRGNALARLGRLADALALYDAALALRPHDPDYRHNRELVARLLKPPPAPPSATPPSAAPPPAAPPSAAPPSSALPPPPTRGDGPRKPSPPSNADEAARAAEQWLRRIPETPAAASAGQEAGAGGASLLRRKLALEAARRAREAQ